MHYPSFRTTHSALIMAHVSGKGQECPTGLILSVLGKCYSTGQGDSAVVVLFVCVCLYFCFGHFNWGRSVFCFVLVPLQGGGGVHNQSAASVIFWSNRDSQYLYLVSVDLKCSHEMRKKQRVRCGDPNCNAFLKGEFIMSELLIPKCNSRYTKTGNEGKLHFTAETQWKPQLWGSVIPA